jgi:hypothetical protein
MANLMEITHSFNKTNIQNNLRSINTTLMPNYNSNSKELRSKQTAPQ